MEAPSTRTINALAQIGAIVIFCQVVEKAIITVLEFALPGVERVTLETLTNERRSNERATLGRLIKKIKERSDLDEDFEEVLTAFLKDRNDLIHNVDRIEGFGVISDDDLARTEAFLLNLRENGDAVLKVFVSLIVEWSDQTGLGRKGVEAVRPLLGDFDGIAPSIFFAKEQR